MAAFVAVELAVSLWVSAYGCVCVCVSLQTVHHSPSLSSIVLFLPFVHLVDKFEEGAFGDRRVSVHGPAKKLELLHHAVPILRLDRDDRDVKTNTHLP